MILLINFESIRQRSLPTAGWNNAFSQSHL